MAAFDTTTTTDEALEGVDLRGKHFVVTGASTGLGEETTRAVAAHGASVSMAVRDVDRGLDAADRVRAAVPDADIEVRQLNLARLASVRAFAEEYLAERDRIDVLINNAGVMACPFDQTVDGFEMQFGTNHLGHFLLTNLLAPALIGGGPSRVIELSSRGHRFSDVDLDDPGFEHTEYDPWIAYGRSKTANVLFSVGFDQRFRDQGVRAFAVHPGSIQTELGRHLTEESMQTMLNSMGQGQTLEWKTIPQGAATSVWAATSTALDDKGGLYLEDCGIAEPVEGQVVVRGVQTYALDPARADALWSLSESLVGLA